MSGLARMRPYATRSLLLTLSGITVWFGESLPVALGVTFLALTLGPLLVASVLTQTRSAAPIRLLPVAALLFVALPISCLVHPRLASTGWLLTGRLVWSIVCMVTIATGRWGKSPSGWVVGLEPRRTLVLATGALMPFVISATNERAGTVAVFVPCALALVLARPSAGVSGGRWRRLLALGALLLYVLALAEAGSRGGWLAALVGCVAVLCVRIPRAQRLRAGVWATILVAVFVTAVLTTATGRDLTATVLTDGSPRGVSWEVTTTGRPAIWRRATMMIEDAPWTGLGLGSFGATAALLYPLPFAGGDSLEDAHQFVLQTWVDIGPLGLLALGWLTMCGVWWSGQRARGAPGPDRSLAAGVLGGLVAWTIFGLGDAVALGTVGNVSFWLMLGVSFTWGDRHADAPASHRGRVGHVPAVSVASVPASGAVALGVLLLSAFVLGWVAASGAGQGPADGAGAGSLGLAIERNRASVGVVGAVLGGRPANVAMARIEAVASRRQGSASPPGCHARWLAGALSGAVDQAEARRDQWRVLLQCSDRYVDVMAVAAPRDPALARIAIETHPTSSRAWRWWAETFPAATDASVKPASRAVDPRAVDPWTVDPGPSEHPAIVAWRRALALAPRQASSHQGVAWRRLGDRLAAEQRWGAALDAYAASCTHGDPGANGCMLAGTLAEDLGDRRQAAAFFARSRWPPARARADRPTR